MSEVYCIPSGHSIRYAYETVFDQSTTPGEMMYEFQGDEESINRIRNKMARVALGAADLGKIPAQAAYFFKNGISDAHMVPFRYIEALDNDAFHQRQMALARGSASGQVSFDDVLREQELLAKDNDDGAYVLDENGIRCFQFDYDGAWIYTDSYTDLDEWELHVGNTLEGDVGAEVAAIIRENTTHVAEQHEFLPYDPEEPFSRARVKKPGYWHDSYGTRVGDAYIPFVTVLHDHHPLRRAVEAMRSSKQPSSVSN